MIKRTLIIFLSTIFLYFSCGLFADTPINRIAAIVNDSVITQTELDHHTRILKTQMTQSGIQLPSDETLKKRVLQNLINQKLQLQVAENTGIRVSNQELNHALNQIATQNKMSLDDLYKNIQKEGMTIAEFQEEIKNEVTIQKLQGRDVASRITIREQEIKDALNIARSSTQTAEQYHVRNILIPLPDTPTPQQVRDAREETAELVKKLNAGADFRAIAAEHSSGEKAMQGGDLGWRTLDELPLVFAKQVTHMNTNQIAGPIQSPNGFHIIQLMGKKGGAPTSLSESEIQMIFLKSTPKTTDEKLAKKMDALKNKLNAGSDFNKLAKTYSQDAKSSRLGGYAGWTEPGHFGPIIDKAIRSLNPGDVSEPLQTSKGWYLIKIIAKRQSTKITASERSRAEQAIFQQKLAEDIQAFINNLRSQAYIKTFA